MCLFIHQFTGYTQQATLQDSQDQNTLFMTLMKKKKDNYSNFSHRSETFPELSISYGFLKPILPEFSTSFEFITLFNATRRKITHETGTLDTHIRISLMFIFIICYSHNYLLNIYYMVVTTYK